MSSQQDSRNQGRSRSRSRSRSPPRYSRSSRRSPSPYRRRSRSRSPYRRRSRSRSSYRRRSRSRSRSRSPLPPSSFRRRSSRSRSRSPTHRNDRGRQGDYERRGGPDSGRGRGGGGGGPRHGGPKHESTFRSGKEGSGAPRGKEVWGAKMIEEEEKNKKPVIAEEDKEKPNFGLSGALAEETNTVNGTVLKYNEPPEARKPTKRWRLYVFKDGKEINVLHIHRQSAFLFGRDRNVADIAIDHPSCSKQHAVLQFRQIVETDQLGQIKRTTKPFVIDLESANGTFVNGAQVPPTRYYELKLSDVLKFGASTREYVLLHEDADAA
ncbi:hypothetical protein BGW42_005518 [Actinomortierella wolfii]|nr:hypothetical protein BGW42_005518 [Actinomortierella wolfii]